MKTKGKSLANTPFELRRKDEYRFSFKKAGYIGLEMAQMLDGLNAMLASHANQIRQTQKNGDGAIVLYLKRCSEGGCIGCPHPVWQRWFNPTKGVDRNKWTAENIKSPLRGLRKDAGKETRNAIKDASAIMEKRGKLILSITSVSKQMKWIEKAFPDVMENKVGGGTE